MCRCGGGPTGRRAKSRLRFTVRASGDIRGIGLSISDGGNPVHARSSAKELRARCVRIVDHPGAAPLRPEYGAGIRAVPLGRFLMLYLAGPCGAVPVVRVVGAAQRPGPVA